MAKRPHTQRCCICTTPRSKRLACCTRVRTPSHADTHDLAATHATRTGAPTTRQRHASHVIAAEGGAVVHKKKARELSAPTRAVAFARARTRPHAPRAGPARAPPPPRGVRTSAKRLNWPNCVTTPSALCSTHAKQKQLLNEAEAIATAAGRTAGLLAPPWTRAGGPRAGGGSSSSGGAGARAGGACAVWHALQPQAYARALICPTAHLISNDVTFSLPRENSVDWKFFAVSYGTLFNPF